MKWGLSATVFFVASALLVGCSGDKNKATAATNNAADLKWSPEVMARVSGRFISTEAYLQHYHRRSRGRIADSADASDYKRLLLDELVSRQAQVLAAERAGYLTDADIQRSLENLLIAKLRQQQLQPQLKSIVIDDAAVAAYYQHNIQKYTQPERIRLAVIQLSSSSKISAEKLQEITALAAEIQQSALTLPTSTAGFGSLAAKHSHDQASRYRGGDIGWHILDGKLSGLDPQLAQAVTVLKNTGEISPLVTAGDGYYLLRLMARKPVQTLPLEQVASNIRLQLNKAQRQTLEANWRASLQQAAGPIKINIAALAAAHLPEFTGRPSQQTPPALPKG